MLRVGDAHQLGGRRIVGDRAKGAPDRRGIEETIEGEDDHDRGDEGHQRRRRRKGPTRAKHSPPEGRQAPAVGGKQRQGAVLQHDRKTERDEQRRQNVLAEQAIEQVDLQRVADDEHQRGDDRQRNEHVDAQALGDDQNEVGRDDDQIAMREIDQPHHAEDQRQTRANRA